MDAAAYAERQEADGVAADAQAGFSKPSVPAGGEVIARINPDPARLGAVLCGRPLQPVFLVHPRLGREEDSGPSGAACQRHGFGWKRWSKAWLYGTLGLFNELPGRLLTVRGTAPAERPHNPCREAVQERVVRQIRMLRARRRELETGLRPLLHGHEGGNPGHSQGAAYGLPRQFPTLASDVSRRSCGCKSRRWKPPSRHRSYIR